MKVLFLHGFESGPGGTKARWLAERYGAVTPRLTTISLAAAVADAERAIAEHRPDLLVGSSFGGAVAVDLYARGTWTGPAVLVAPAHAHFGGATRLPVGARVIVLHGDADDVVPIDPALGGDLRVIPGGDHRLNRVLDDGTLAVVIDELRRETAATSPVARPPRV